jgi:mono/diheme cytochrome c family protein
MQIRRILAVSIALALLSLGVLSACGGSDQEAGTINQDVTIGAETNAATPVTGADTEGAETGAETAAAEGDAAAGASVFQSAGCGGCHALAAAGSNGAVGPNLNSQTYSYDAVLTVVTNGRGAMPSYSGQLSEDEIRNVSAYVAENSGQ